MIEYKRLSDVGYIHVIEILKQEWEGRICKIHDTVEPLFQIIKFSLITSEIGLMIYDKE